MNRKERRARAKLEFDQQKDSQKLGDGPVQEQYHAQMRAIMETLDDFMNPGLKGDKRKVGITVLIYPFNDLGDGEGRVNYMSNGADRKDVVVMMKEMIRRFEGQPEVTGTA